jgi:hypothetical protein
MSTRVPFDTAPATARPFTLPSTQHAHSTYRPTYLLPRSSPQTATPLLPACICILHHLLWSIGINVTSYARWIESVGDEMKEDDKSCIDAPMSSSQGIITSYDYEDGEMIDAEQQPTSASAGADNVSTSKDDDPAQESPHAVTASRTTSILIVLIAILAVVVIALLAVVLTGPSSSENRLQSENQSANDTPRSTPFPTPTPTNRPTSAIPNWNIRFLQLLLDFSFGSPSEITFKYQIGSGRTYLFGLFDSGCTENVTGLNVTTTTVVTPKDYDYDNLDVLLDVMNMSTIAESNIWNPNNSTMEMCIKLQLLSESGCVIREDARNIGITIDFSNNLSEVVTLGSGFKNTLHLSADP